MFRYRGRHLLRHGLVGIVLILCVISLGLQSQQAIAWGTTVRYQAVFQEAGGLEAGDEVIVSGVRVGSVTEVGLDHGDARVVFTVRSSVPVGAESSVQIKTGSLLGKRIMTLVPRGTEHLRPLDTIPVERTSSPYSLTDALGDLTTTAGAMDTDSLNNSLNMLSSTLDQIAPQLGPAFDGLSELSKSINSRNTALRDLLTASRDVTAILADRSQQVNTMLLNANTLIGVLDDRRQAIATLLANTAAVADQLTKLVADNEARLGPALDRLNSVAALLQRNRDNIAAAIPGLAKASLTQGEAVSGGPFYNAYVANLIPAQWIRPFVDAAFGGSVPQPPAPQPAAPQPGAPQPEAPR
ncbi:MCE family protein [Nocardia rhamnosiphila]|uniref:MCE family protein n=1 Tax=Nocardia rhamnosiphila TaxID=426716 RepID=UPI0004C2BE41|nr:MCE family protein [Nocardia rhamnosiphila]